MVLWGKMKNVPVEPWAEDDILSKPPSWVSCGRRQKKEFLVSKGCLLSLLRRCASYFSLHLMAAGGQDVEALRSAASGGAGGQDVGVSRASASGEALGAGALRTGALGEAECGGIDGGQGIRQDHGLGHRTCMGG